MRLSGFPMPVWPGRQAELPAGVTGQRDLPTTPAKKHIQKGGGTMLKVIEIFEKLAEICDMIIAWLDE